jgi:hypothetical protein
LTASDAAKNIAGQIRALSGGRRLRDGDAGPYKDAEIEFSSYGRTPIVGHDISPRVDGLLGHDASRHRHFGFHASWLRFTLASFAFMEKFN